MEWKDGKWECLLDGDCCELFSQFTIGFKECPQLKEDKSCGCYSARPKFCRVDSFEVPGLDKDEYLIARCHLIHKLKKWRDEVGDSKSTDYILRKISESGLK
jgi:Fe-S-cluster containining protein